MTFFRCNNKMYIDVWPLNFLKPSDNDAFDTTSLFMMQLACIVNMVPQWSKLILRVCVCDEVKQSSFSLSSSSQANSERLKNLLVMLRISAELHPVIGWADVMETHDRNAATYLKR